MIKFLFFSIFFVFVCQFSSAQSAPPLIEISVDAPEWMKMFEKPTLNVLDIQKANSDYYSIHKFQKNRYTQYYKRFMRWARPHTMEDGSLIMADNTILAIRERKALACRSTSNRTDNWTFAGPKKPTTLTALPKLHGKPMSIVLI
ncbi:MAG: hypothetical protein IPO92_14105 [Saprospiraceae bacterium]|nr:hypothetical protein [Saprospiraceae bacterium]